MNKGQYKSVRNSNLTIKNKRKSNNNTVIATLPITSIDQALLDLKDGNTTAVGNFIKSLKNKYNNPSNKKKEILNNYAQELKRSATPAEKELMRVLKANSIIFTFQKVVHINKSTSYILDFYIPTLKACIEVDGGYHNTQEQQLKDADRTLKLLSKNIEVYRISNDDVMDSGKLSEFLTNLGLIKIA